MATAVRHPAPVVETPPPTFLKREEAEARNALTPPVRRKAARKAAGQ